MNRVDNAIFTKYVKGSKYKDRTKIVFPNLRFNDND